MGLKKNNSIIHKKGFTLIELLVVISIISLLSSIVLVTVNTARSRAVNAKHALAVHEIDKALAMYYLDEGKYPVTSGWRTNLPCPPIACSWAGYTWSLSINDVIPGLSPKYMPQMREEDITLLYTSLDGKEYMSF